LIERAVRLLRLAEDALLVAALATMIGLAAYQVVARNFFDTGILWGDALVRELVLWITFIGATVASRHDDHIRIDLLARYVRPARQILLVRFRSLFVAAVAGVFAWYSGQFVLLDYQDGVTAFAAVPAWVCETIMPIGSAIIALRYLLHVVRPPDGAGAE